MKSFPFIPNWVDASTRIVPLVALVVEKEASADLDMSLELFLSTIARLRFDGWNNGAVQLAMIDSR